MQEYFGYLLLNIVLPKFAIQPIHNGKNINMTPEAAEQAAEIFLQCREQGNKIDTLPEACRPTTINEGYEIQ